jgi:hypothetical protein
MLQATLLAAVTPTWLAATSSVSRLVVPLTIFLLLSAVLIGALAIVRRKVRAEAGSSGPRDFSLGDLRALHREGKLTTEEFERAKAKLVGNVRATLQKEAKPSRVEQPFVGELKETFADDQPGRASDDDSEDRES